MENLQLVAMSIDSTAADVRDDVAGVVAAESGESAAEAVVVTWVRSWWRSVRHLNTWSQIVPASDTEPPAAAGGSSWT